MRSQSIFCGWSLGLERGRFTVAIASLLIRECELLEYLPNNQVPKSHLTCFMYAYATRSRIKGKHCELELKDFVAS